MAVRKLHVGIIDLVTKNPTRALYARVMNANLAGIMSQIVATWCEEEGHDVTFVCYTGFENLVDELPADVDLVVISTFTQAAQALGDFKALTQRGRRVLRINLGADANVGLENVREAVG